MARRDISPTEVLTPREQEILRMVSAGLTNAEIANILGISFPTVRNHVSSILSKLGATTREQAVERWCQPSKTAGIAAGWKRWVRGLVPGAAIGGMAKAAAGGMAVLFGGTALVAAVAITSSLNSDGEQVVAAPEPTATATPAPDPVLLAAREEGQYELFVMTQNILPDMSTAEYRERISSVAACFEEQGYTVVGPMEHEPSRITFTAFNEQHSDREHPLPCFQEPTPLWDDVMSWVFYVAADEAESEKVRGDIQSSQTVITLSQREMLADGRVTVDEHARAAERAFTCAREYGGTVDTSQFDPASHEPYFTYGSRGGPDCLAIHYEGVQMVWVTFENPQNIADFKTEMLRNEDDTDIRVILASPDGSPIENADDVTGCIEAAGHAFVVRESPDDRLVVDVLVDDVEAASQQLTSCDVSANGSLVVLQLARLSPEFRNGESPDLPPPSPFILSSGAPYARALEDGIVTTQELRSTRNMYLTCLEEHGWTVNRDAPMDGDIQSLYAAPDGADMTKLNDWRRMCEIGLYGGIEEVWALQQANGS